MPELNKALLEKASKENIELVSARYEKQQPQCLWGLNGTCCKNCFQGPCRIIPGKAEKGICGAGADLIVARNFLRSVAAGTTGHTDHAKEIALALLEIAEGRTHDYGIADAAKLKNLAGKLGIKTSKPAKKIAKEVALEALGDFRRQQGLFLKPEGKYLNWLRIHATKERIEKWKKLNILPVNADAETSHALNQTTMGCDADPADIMIDALRVALADGYSGLAMASDLQDVVFGSPRITKSTCNLGVLDEGKVNIIVHGHVPLLGIKVVEFARKLEAQAKKAGARGINVVGMCCSGHEALERQGIPVAGHMLQQELAIVTGAADAIAVDMQCIFPALQDVAQCYHTKLITTMDFVKIPGAKHIPFTVHSANKSAKKIVMEAIEAYKKRDPAKVFIPKEKNELYAGFGVESLINALAKVNAANPLKPLVDALKSGDIYGIAAIAGCRNLKVKGNFHEELTKILLKNNVLVIGTGCWAHAAAQAGLMNEGSVKYAGAKLRNVLKAIGNSNGLSTLPACLHFGSCVDNSRISALLEMVSEKTKIPIYKLPIAGSAPEYATEKALAIGTFFLALGITLHVNPIPEVTGSKLISKILTQDLEKITGARVLLAETPEKAAGAMLQAIRQKRQELDWR
ncbi:MAG: anaerobic carbon-monoxide dehydrogenase catalytic subunit [Candidatus Diapherotrites archaeon]|nr:anaerobic carbon-monoxide dehydrogenase catalytic subunit [Candidatus Diapherotrites archaeon]